MTESIPETRAARPTTLAEIRDSAAIPVFSEREPNLAGLLGMARCTAYADTRNGNIPAVKVGRRTLVPVPALRRLLGDLPELETTAAH